MLCERSRAVSCVSSPISAGISLILFSRKMRVVRVCAEGKDYKNTKLVKREEGEREKLTIVKYYVLVIITLAIEDSTTTDTHACTTYKYM